MAKRIEVRDAVGESRNEFQCVMFPEQYHGWSVLKPWDGSPVKEAGLEIASIEVKSSKSTGACDVQEFDKKEPLRLKCGVEITNGRVATTTQNKTARFQIRVDSVRELNSAMKELSIEHDMRNWEVSKLQVINPKLGAILNYQVHSPNGLETRLYLKSAETPEYSKGYELINLFEQQRLCNNFYEYFASCSISEQVVKAHHCALEKRKIKSTRTPQKGWRKKASTATQVAA